MKNTRSAQSGYTLVELILVCLFIFFIGSWVTNGIKLASCDFEPNYRCEFIHGAGLFVPPLSMITVWFDTDE